MIIRQICVPDYRRGLFEALHASCKSLRVATGAEFFTPTIRAISDTPLWLVRGRSWFLFFRRAVWLQGISDLLKPGDLLVHELNPRIISQWRDLMMCRVRGVNFVLWGHAWGRSGTKGLEFKLRMFINRRADGIIAYTESQAEIFRRHVGSIPVIAAPNACMSQADCSVTGEEALRDAVIYVGRIVPEKKVGLLVEGFAAACRYNTDFKARLAIIGDGPDRARLEARARELGVADRVEWHGHQAEIAVLRSAYARAFVSVTPGYVGLSLTQSFAFGVPALIARDEPHSPEIEAAQEGVNARYFASDDISDLAAKLQGAWREWRGIEVKRKELAAWTAENYSFEKMADRFLEMAKLICMKETN